MTKPQIAIVVGSNRRDSINRKLAQALVKLGASQFDAKLVRIDDLPLYNQDLEANLPPQVARWRNNTCATCWSASAYSCSAARLTSPSSRT
jgi:NAD(P)H-dependent FMN reductase